MALGSPRPRRALDIDSHVLQAVSVAGLHVQAGPYRSGTDLLLELVGITFFDLQAAVGRAGSLCAPN